MRNRPLALVLVLSVGTALAQAPQSPAKRWFKGNLHTHTLNSDGDSTPHEVTTWYREHGYNFLVLTDHNHLTDITGLNGEVGLRALRHALAAGAAL